MDKQEQQQLIKETVAHAKNAWGNEDSKLAGYILSKIEPTIKESIDRNVNGKIIALSQRFDEYVKSDNEWKAQVTPQIEAVKRFQGFTIVGGSIVQGILSLSGIGAIIWGIFKFINSLKV